MKFRILLGALLIILFSATASNAQRYHRGYRGGYNRGYYHRPGVVVVTPPVPRVVVGNGYYGRGGYYNDGYYGRGYRRGYYGRGYRRGYYGHRPYRNYGYGYGYGHRRHHYRGRW